MPQTLHKCPCNLFVVIANTSRTWNCKRLKSNSNLIGIIGMLLYFVLEMVPRWRFSSVSLLQSGFYYKYMVVWYFVTLWLPIQLSIGNFRKAIPVNLGSLKIRGRHHRGISWHPYVINSPAISLWILKFN